MIDYQKSELLVTLKEALDLTQSSVTPGALNVNGKTLVQEDDYGDKYLYYANFNESSPISLDSSQLERMVPGARYKSWIPCSNFVGVW